MESDLFFFNFFLTVSVCSSETEPQTSSVGFGPGQGLILGNVNLNVILMKGDTTGR